MTLGGRPLSHKSGYRRLPVAPRCAAGRTSGRLQPRSEVARSGRHGIRLAVVAAAALAILACNPIAALASRASVTNGTPNGTLKYLAAAGEANHVDIAWASGGYTITDTGATITAGAGCTSIDAHHVSCPPASILTLEAKDLADTVTVSTPTFTIVNGGSGDDTLVGGSGVDTFDGGPGDDALGGGDASDFLIGGTGADFLRGGGGVDTASYSGRAEGVTADIGGGADDGGSGDGPPDARDDIQSDIENIDGGDGNDVLTGDGGPNTLWGGRGADVLSGEDGDDELFGDSGADSLSGGGGAGDVVNYIHSGSAVVADIGGGADDGNGDDGPPGGRDNIHGDVESIKGGQGGDVLTGDGDSNVLDGGPGADTLRGHEGVDFLLGSTGNDALDGGSDGDLLDGGADDDSLFGGGGDDTLLQPGHLQDEALRPDGADVISGGDGIDRADYSFRTAAVIADPGGGRNDGEDTNRDRVADEHDDINADVEDIAGGSGNDALSGDDRGNRLEGGGGSDVLNGRGGDDVVMSRDAAADSVACGDGNDSVTADSLDAIGADCEVIRRATSGGAPPSPAPQPVQQPPVSAQGSTAATAPPTKPTGTGKACAGLKGRKLKRCKALARCNKLRGARKKRCRAVARCRGLKSAKRKRCLKKARRVGRR